MYKEILVTLDGSDLAEGALLHAVAIAKSFSARLTLMFVIEPTVAYVQPTLGGSVIDTTVVINEEINHARNYLNEMKSHAEAEGIVVLCVVKNGDPASEICDYAVANKVDMIVMCTHGRSGIKRWVYGSVADKVLRCASAPVLLIRAIPQNASSEKLE